MLKRTGATKRGADRNKKHVLALVDIDDFKSWNDRLNYTQNDREALIPVANILASSMRPDSDLVGRFGGEEFAMLLGETDEEGGAVVCHKIQAQINDIHPDQQSADRLGATIAFMTFEQGESLEEALGYLSTELNLAKQIPGKNQIIAVPAPDGNQLRLFTPDKTIEAAPVDAYSV